MLRRGKILVIRGGAIGDFILTLPVLAALRQRFPDVHLEVLGYPHIAQLAVAGGLVDRVQPIEAGPLAGFFARGGTLSQRWCDYFSEFDVIVSYLYDPDQVFYENLARCTCAQFIQGPHRAAEADRIHATKVYLKPLEQLAIYDADNVPRLAVSSQTPSPNTVALHPGSGSERKNWPEYKWQELIRRLLAETKLHLLIVGGEAEGERLERLTAKLAADRFSLARSLPLVELASRLQGCVAFVGHDSGITHLAAALGLPCLVLWSDTAEEVWRPPAEKTVLLRESAGLNAITVDRVMQQLMAMLP